MIDSGVGGLSVLREIHTLLPKIAIQYIADTAWCPYGTKSSEEIRDRTFALTEFLIAKGAELIVIACNSATIAAIEALRTQFPVSFIGMEPGIKPAATLTKTHTIGVLATELSLRGDKFLNLVSNHAGHLRVITQPCPKFVELVEAGTLVGELVEAAIVEYTRDMMNADADVLILGCSHYPFLRPALESHLPAEIQLIDTGHAIARRVKDLNPQSDASAGIDILTTGSPLDLTKLLPILIPGIPANCHSFSIS
ncbi:UNVERIFIED_CONTAM: hypothetical protein GTU68_005183 [Idotea baltica]|nr:hypothetical protein [Idotea baltica]